MKIQLLTTSAFVLGSLCAPMALAQDADEPAATRTLDTVTVTAQKREQTLQDVPVAVSVVGQEQIAKAQVLDLSDLQTLVPSLRVSTLQNSAQTTFLIRGFGNGANNAGIEPSVGVFIDGVYRSRSAAAIADLPNLARVEVLRGPQSTLFGKNASAGVISVVTQEPSFDFNGLAEVGVTNYNGYNAKGYVTGPITDTVAFALSGNYSARDGYTENLLGGEDVNDRNRYGLRGELLFEPNDDLSVRLMADYSNIDEICCTVSAVEYGPTAGAIAALGGALLDASDPFSYEVYFNQDPVNEVEDRGLSGTVEYDFGPAILTSITAYRENDSFYDSEVDYSGADLIDSVSSDTAIETFTQEFRLTSDTDEPVSWLLGAFFFSEDVDQQTGLGSGTMFRPYVDILVDGAPLGPNGTLAGIEQALGFDYGTFYGADRQSLEYFTQSDDSTSLFAQLDWEVTDRLTLTGGLNYTKVEKDVTGYTDNNYAFSALEFDGAEGAQVLTAQGYAMAFPAVFQANTGLAPTDANYAAFASAYPDVFAQLQAGTLAQVQAGVAQIDLSNPAQNPLLGLQQLQFVPQFLGFPNSVEDGHSNDEETTWTLRAAFDVNDYVNIYFSGATGFKASSWNLSRDSRPFASDMYGLVGAGLDQPNQTYGTRYAGPEKSTVYEIGVKASFDTAQVNLTLFDQTIEGFQSNIFTGTGFALANAGKQSASGVELDVLWRPVEPLTLSFAGTFLDPVYDSFVDTGIFDAQGNQIDLSGQTPAGIHETSISTSALYEHDFANGWVGFLRGEYQYESEAQVVDNVQGVDREVNTVNASMGLELNDGWSARVWGRNIFNDEYFVSAFPGVAQSGTIYAYPNQPATYGVSVRKEF